MKRDPEFQLLVQRFVDGQATATEVGRLNERLRRDAEARQWFIELLDLDSALTEVSLDWAANEEFGSALSVTPSSRETLSVERETSPQPSVENKPRLTRGRAAAAACVALLVASAWWWQSPPRVFATVRNIAGVNELAEGAVIHGERYQIQAGTLNLITVRGAQVVIEAPAEFRFETAQRLRLMQGRLSADVPPSAKGFTVITPTGQAVDLGTKFGVDVPLRGEAEIHVFQGEVIAQSSAGGKRQSVRDGEAFRLQSGAGTPRELRSAAFIRPEEVTLLHAALEAGQRASSGAALAELRRDPALITLLDFESHELPSGNYRVAQGRWPGSHAPEFVNVGDHMQLDIGGDREWPQLTLAVWVRLDRLGEPFQSLLHTDGWGNNFGQVHWMVTRHTTMRLALFGITLAPGSDEHDGYPDSRTPVLSEQGRWTHLATVYDSDQRTVRFYLNGGFDKETRLSIAYPARLGPAQIGNWNGQDRKLSGRIDELLLLGRAMTDAEVRALYVAGNPYR
jgi:hypothetical protein